MRKNKLKLEMKLMKMKVTMRVNDIAKNDEAEAIGGDGDGNAKEQ